MTRAQLEHVIRAAASITNENPIVVVGSQSILGRYPDAPQVFQVSMEADICPLDAPEKADLISGSIGKITIFQNTYGYYAHGLPPEACPLPSGWKDRLVEIRNENTNGYTGLCLHPDDLACFKLAAGRPKDIDFAGLMLTHRMTSELRLRELIPNLPSKDRALGLQSLAAALARPGRE